VKHFHALFLIGALFLSATAMPQGPQKPLSPVSERIKNLCTEQEKREKFSGSIYVKTHFGVEIDEALGEASSAMAVPNTSETAYRVGAITRVFTATAILKLVADGRLNLDETLQKLLPEFQGKNSSKITLHNLLSNSSGIPDYLPTWKTAWRMRAGAEEPPPGGTEKLIASITDLGSRFEPGTKADHSSSNALLLGRILEKVENTNYPSLMKKFFKSNGLTKTGFFIDQEVPASARATGYTAFSQLDPRFWLSANPKNSRTLRHPEWDMAASGAYSTTHDVALWVNAFLSGAFLPETWRNKMIEKHISKSPARWFGYGWEIHQMNNVEGLVLTGAHPGYQSLVVHVPQTQTTVVVLENFGDTPSGRNRFFRDIVNAALQEN
jgi:CubicO group peptidase (beta-lactamase class C family)